MAQFLEMDPKQFLRDRFLTGAFWDTRYPDLQNVRQEDVDKLDIGHRLAKDAIASWQASDANFDIVSLILNLRNIIADGDLGPVSAIMAQAKRCPMPDNAPPPGAVFDYGHAGLNEAVQSYQRWAEASLLGSGSWPNCDPNRPDVHSTRVNIDTKDASAHQKGILKEATGLVEKCEAEIGQAVRHIFDGDPTKAEHDVRFEFISGGVIGYCYFPEPDTCDQVVQCRIDNSYNPGVVTLANLLTHEYKGHGDGLEHTNGDIMNPSIITINPLSWKGDKSESIKRRYFGGVPIAGGPVDPIDPTEPPDHNGVVVIEGKLYKTRFWLA